MEEELDKIISEQLDLVNAASEEDINRIDEIIAENKNQVQEIEYRKELLEILEKVKKLGVEIEFNEDMTTEELEDLLRRVKV